MWEEDAFKQPTARIQPHNNLDRLASSMRIGIPAALRGLCVNPGSATMGSPCGVQYEFERSAPHSPIFDHFLSPSSDGAMYYDAPTSTAPQTTGFQSTQYSGTSTPCNALDRSANTRVSAYRDHSANLNEGARVDGTLGSDSGHGHRRDNQIRGRYIPYTANPRSGKASKDARVRVRTRQPALGRWNTALDLELTPRDSTDSGNTLFREQRIYEVFPRPEVESSRYADTQTIERSMDDLSLSGSRRLEYDTLGRPYGFAQSPPSSPMPPPSPPSSREDDDVWGPYIPSRVHAVRKKSQSYKGYYLELPDLDTDSGSDSDSLDSDDGDSHGGGGDGRRRGRDKLEHGPHPHNRTRKSPRSTLTEVHVVDGDAYDRFADNLDHAREEFAWRHGWY